MLVNESFRDSSMRVKSSLQNIGTGLIGQVVTLGINFLNRTVFIYVLGATYLGVSSLFGNILSILAFAELGFGQAMTFALYKPLANKDYDKVDELMTLYKRVCHWLFWIITGLGLALFPFLHLFVNDMNAVPHLRLYYLMYLASTATTYLFSYKATLLFADQKNYISTTISIIGTILTCAIQITALVTTANFTLYLALQIICGVGINYAVARKADSLYPFLRKKVHGKLPTEEVSTIKKNVKALAIYKIGTLSLNSTDSIIISKFVSLISVGFYSNYALLATSVSGFLTTVFGNITGSIGNLNATETVERKLFIFKVLDLATYWFYGVVAIVLFNCMTPFIVTWVGDGYVLPVAVSVMISLNAYVGGMLYSPFNYRQSMGLFTQGKMRPVISAVLNIAFSIPFAIYWGVAGVLLGTLVTRLTTNAWFDPYIVFRRGLGLSPWIYFRSYFSKALILVVTWIVCAWIGEMIYFPGLIGVMVLGLVTLAFSATMLLVPYWRTAECRYIVNVVANSRKILFAK